MKKDKNKVLYDIQEEYFSIIESYYEEFYSKYKKSNLGKREFVLHFLKNHKSIDLLNGEDSLSVRRCEFGERIHSFWNEKSKVVRTCLDEYFNVGIFGSVDDKYPVFYENEIRQNALYYDMLILNDPFFEFHANKMDYKYAPFVYSFYVNILSLMELKQYILGKTKQVYVIIYPTDIVISSDDKDRVFAESASCATSIARSLFGLDYSSENNFPHNLKKLKELTDDEIQQILAKNNIYVNLEEAQDYEHNAMSEESKEFFARFMVEAWGGYNRDFIRCVLNNQAIRNIITTNHYVYKMHSVQALRLKANPIFNIDEWEPFLYDVAGVSYPASDEFKYMCAIHRNDKMAMMLQLSADEIEIYRNKKDVEVFRAFLRKTTSYIHNTPENFEEIAEEVFERFDAMIDAECKTLSEARCKGRFKALWGIGKSVMGFIPNISVILGLADTGIAAKNFCSTLQDKKTILEVLKKRKD